MPPHIKEVQSYYESLQAARQGQANVNIELLRAAEARATKLLGTPEWDSYIQQCQHLLNVAQQQMEQWLMKLAGCVTEDGENGTHHCRREYHAWAMRYNTIHELMQKPSAIIAETRKVTDAGTTEHS